MSPDCVQCRFNPLALHFWIASQKQVYASKPTSIDEINECVMEYANEYCEFVSKNDKANVLKHAG